jgi:hypothetical protein
VQRGSSGIMIEPCKRRLHMAAQTAALWTHIEDAAQAVEGSANARSRDTRTIVVSIFT